MQLTWQESDFSTGHEEVDNDHKRIVEIVNELISGIESEDPSHAVLGSLATLQTFASEHFRREEQVMQEVECPAYLQNKKEHMQFEAHLSNFNLQFEKYGATRELLKELLIFLVEWFRTHVGGTDLILRNFPREKAEKTVQ